MENLQSENQEIIQLKLYSDLKLKEKRALNKEYYGKDTRPPIAILAVMLLGMASMITAIIFLLMGFKSAVIGQSYYNVLIGYSFGSFGAILILPGIQLISAKRMNKDIFEQYGKKMLTILIAVFVVGFIGCILQFIALIYRTKWLFYLGLIPASIGVFTHAIFILRNTKNNREQDLIEDKKFCEWLEKNKNIIKENRILK